MAGGRRIISVMGNKRKDTVIIGVTGGFGTGKTTVSRLFRKLGAALIDADEIGHLILKKGTPVYKRVIETFGPLIIAKSGEIDRTELGKKVFSDKRALKKLGCITHPTIIREINLSVRSLIKSGKAPVIVIDAPLLIESGLHKIVDYVVVVTTSNQTQLKRIRQKTGLGKREAAKRIRCQIPLRRKAAMADFIIDNEASKRRLKETVKKIWREIKSDTDK